VVSEATSWGRYDRQLKYREKEVTKRKGKRNRPQTLRRFPAASLLLGRGAFQGRPGEERIRVPENLLSLEGNGPARSFSKGKGVVLENERRGARRWRRKRRNPSQPGGEARGEKGGPPGGGGGVGWEK